MANISQAAGPKHRSLAELEEAGVSAVTFPSAALFAAAHAVRHVVRSLKRDNGLTHVGDTLLSLEDYYNLVGLKAQMAREERYDTEAAAMVRRREAAE
jgi:methylisocitrate lyase